MSHTLSTTVEPAFDRDPRRHAMPRLADAGLRRPQRRSTSRATLKAKIGRRRSPRR